MTESRTRIAPRLELFLVSRPKPKKTKSTLVTLVLIAFVLMRGASFLGAFIMASSAAFIGGALLIKVYSHHKRPHSLAQAAKVKVAL